MGAARADATIERCLPTARSAPQFYDADKPRASDAELAWYDARLPRDAGPGAGGDVRFGSSAGPAACSADSTCTASTRPLRCSLRAKRDLRPRNLTTAAVPAGPGGAQRSVPLWRGVRRRGLVPAARRSRVGEVGARAHPRASRTAGAAAAGPVDSRRCAASACRAAGRGARSQAIGRRTHHAAQRNARRHATRGSSTSRSATRSARCRGASRARTRRSCSPGTTKRRSRRCSRTPASPT